MLVRFDHIASIIVNADHQPLPAKKELARNCFRASSVDFLFLRHLSTDSSNDDGGGGNSSGVLRTNSKADNSHRLRVVEPTSGTRVWFTEEGVCETSEDSRRAIYSNGQHHHPLTLLLILVVSDLAPTSLLSARARRRSSRSADRPAMDPKAAAVSIGHR